MIVKLILTTKTASDSNSVRSASSASSKHNPPLFIRDDLRNDVRSYDSEEDYDDEESTYESQSHDFVGQISLPDQSYESIPKQVYSYQYTGSYESDS